MNIWVLIIRKKSRVFIRILDNAIFFRYAKEIKNNYMSGHNKWSQIKNKKAVTDGKRSKIFGKFSKLIALESKKAAGNLTSPGLRAVIERAKKENMQNELIERAVKKGAGGDAGNMEPVLFEAYGPGGCAIIIEGLTDNNNRTVAEMKHIFSKRGFSLAGQGAAEWAFTKTSEGYEPQTTVPLSEEDGALLSSLLEELDDHDDVQEVYTNAD